jgi:hypothetical protein
MRREPALSVKRTFVGTGIRYLVLSNFDLDGEEGALDRIKADYKPLALTVSLSSRL